MIPKIHTRGGLAVLVLLLVVLLGVVYWNGFGEGKSASGRSSEDEANTVRDRLDESGSRQSAGHSQQRREFGVEIRLKALMDVRKGEVRMIRIPSSGVKEWIELLDNPQLNQDGPGIGALFSRDQAEMVLKGVLSGDERLDSELGSLGMVEISGERMGVQVTTTKGNKETLDLQVRISEGVTEGSKSRESLTGLTVFQGHCLLVRSSHPDPEGVLIVTSEDP